MVNYNFKPRTQKDEYGWYGLGYLPHFDGPEQTQFLTFRLFDSMPQDLLDRWRIESRDDIQFRKKVEKYLDAGYGSSWLCEPDIASIVCNSLQFHHHSKYDLDSWVIMPNHVHVLLTPLPGFHLDQVEHSIKSYTANEANKVLKRKGQFWAAECFDRYIRDWRHFNAVVRYIENNPVKADYAGGPRIGLLVVLPSGGRKDDHSLIDSDLVDCPPAASLRDLQAGMPALQSVDVAPRCCWASLQAGMPAVQSVDVASRCC